METKDCMDCWKLRHCPGTCQEMDAIIENNKITVEAEDKQWSA